jgi:HD-GYP domain-containing protein (c-di-GMP phosphodiesterase class II)
MLRICTAEARSGMVLALPVFHPGKTDHVLLKPGAVLTADLLSSLREIGVNRLFIQYPPLQRLLKFMSADLLHENARLTARLGECFDQVAQDVHADLDFRPYAEAVKQLLEKVIADPEAALFVQDMSNSRQPILSHCSNVCYLSILMGLKLEGYLVQQRPTLPTKRAQNIESLGVGAMMHDIGLLRLSPGILQNWLRTQDDSDPEYQKHCTLGFDTVRGKVAPTAAAAVLHHHQRMDGSGFPLRRRLDGSLVAPSGRDIHIFARIVAVADVFDRLRCPMLPAEETVGTRGRNVAPPPMPPSVPVVRALKQMLPLVRNRKLDRVVFNAMLSVSPAFAPGTLVLLNDGTMAAVTDWSPLDPCRPTVVPIHAGLLAGHEGAAADDEGHDHTPEMMKLGDSIDLRVRTDLHIVSADGVDVENDLFSPQHASEFDLRLPIEGYLRVSATGDDGRKQRVPQPGVRAKVAPRKKITETLPVIKSTASKTDAA